MAKDFAFRNHHDPESDVLASRHHANKLRTALRSAGHDARVEAGDREPRVIIHHPTDKDSVAYVNREEAPRLVEKEWKPYWIRK